ncbi:MAG: hypothetical protein DSY34_04530 [Desulfurobacterium sp.]|nr:MAG: hypothetical protein DSY34_04530 [Desulfurobacterium sp.]
MKSIGTRLSSKSLEQIGDRYYCLLIAFISLIFFFSRLYEPSLSGDAAKYALIAKNMLKSGNYLVPDLGIELYFKKPPFFFWLIALSYKLFGISEFSARLPSAIFALADALLVYLIARRISDSKLVAFMSSLVFIINFEVIRISTVIRFESFILFVNLSTILLLLKPSFIRSLVAGMLVGFGLLTKGPFALLGLAAVVIYFILKRDFEKISYQVFSLFIGCLIFGVYLFYMAAHHPEFFKEFFGNQILGRFEGTLNEGTPRSFFFYERILLKHFWIWNVFLLYFIFMVIKNGREYLKEIFSIKDKDLWSIFVIMFLIVFLPLHLVSLKFTRYSYYLYPFLSLIVGYVVVKKGLLKPVALYIAAVTLIYSLIVMACPCKFHKDKLKDLRPLVEVGINNFHSLGIDKSIDKLTAYSLLFYYDLSINETGYFLAKGAKCSDSLVKFKSYCIVEEKR